MKCFTITLRKVLLLLILCQLSSDQIMAQRLLNRVVDRAVRKVESRVEDMIVEKASEAIARKLYASMEDAFDKILRDAYGQDSLSRASSGDSLGIKYAEWAATVLSRLNESVDLPDQFDFDLRLDMEISDGKEQQEMTMMLSDKQPYMALEQHDRGQIRIMLIDLERDYVVLFTEDKQGGKHVQAIPGMIGLGLSMAAQYEPDTAAKWNVVATGEEKTIAGYKAKGYRGTDGKSENVSFITPDVGIKWSRSYAKLLERFGKSAESSWADWPDGMVMESRTHEIADQKQVSQMLVKKVDKSGFSLITAEYQPGVAEMEE